jgi:hypothetical protein
MGKVMVRLSMSLDGFIAGPNDGPENPWATAVSIFLNGIPAVTPTLNGRVAR